MTTDPRRYELLAYMAKLARQRAADVDRALAAMTERERQLVREAAVGGYMYGTYSGQMINVPPDSEIVTEVVSRIRSMPDLYPAMSALARRDEETR